jgi:hypothetical protein
VDTDPDRVPTALVCSQDGTPLTVTVPVGDIDLDGARELILKTAAAIREELYAPTPNPLCDWCDFKAICPAWADEGATELLGPAVAEIGGSLAGVEDIVGADETEVGLRVATLKGVARFDIEYGPEWFPFDWAPRLESRIAIDIDAGTATQTTANETRP